MHVFRCICPQFMHVIHAHVVYVSLMYGWMVACKCVVHEYVVYVYMLMCVVQCTYVCGHMCAYCIGMSSSVEVCLSLCMVAYICSMYVLM